MVSHEGDGDGKIVGVSFVDVHAKGSRVATLGPVASLASGGGRKTFAAACEYAEKLGFSTLVRALTGEGKGQGGWSSKEGALVRVGHYGLSIAVAYSLSCACLGSCCLSCWLVQKGEASSRGHGMKKGLFLFRSLCHPTLVP